VAGLSLSKPPCRFQSTLSSSPLEPKICPREVLFWTGMWVAGGMANTETAPVALRKTTFKSPPCISIQGFGPVGASPATANAGVISRISPLTRTVTLLLTAVLSATTRKLFTRPSFHAQSTR